MTIGEMIVAKATSGRFLFTLLCGLAFLEMAVTGLLPPSDCMTVIMVVAAFYFNRPDRTPKDRSDKGERQNPPKPTP